MAGLVPAIHVLPLCTALKTWMPGTKPGMTTTSRMHRGWRARPERPRSCCAIPAFSRSALHLAISLMTCARRSSGVEAFAVAPTVRSYFSSSIGLRSTPMPSISISHTSPFFIHTGFGLRAWPTPDGVPVKMMSPGSSVSPCVT